MAKNQYSKRDLTRFKKEIQKRGLNEPANDTYQRSSQ